MKNKLFKKVKLFVTMLLIGIIFAANSGVGAVAKTISVGSASYAGNYIDGVGFHIKATTSGKYLYCVERLKTLVKNTTGTLVGEKDAGFAYLVKNGYPNKSFTGDKKKDYYITQSAIWWYIDEIKGTNSLSKAFKTTAKDEYNLRKHMKTLVEGAKAARKKGYAKTTLSIKSSSANLKLSSDKQYYVSESISVTSSNISKYSVELSNAPSGTIVVDAKGSKKTSFSKDEKFIVKVPASKIKELKTNFTVKVSASGYVEKVYEYKPADSTMQNFITIDLVKETTNVSDKLNLSISSSKVTIQKTDKATGKALAGAKLVVKDSKGTVVHKWTSLSTEAEVIYNLPNGKYTIEETEAPKGYEKLTTVKSFTISDSNKNITVKVENQVKKGVVTILKIDKATKKALAGAELVLKNSKGTVVHKWTSTTEAEVIENLENGKYTIEETKAPNGYLKLDKVKSFTITDSNKNIEIKLENEARKSVVTITKIDKSTNETLAGAILVVKDQSGAQKAKFTTTTDSYTILDLPNGTYTVVEESAPTGYQKSDEVITFTIDDNNLTHQITFYNYPEVKVPDTATTSSSLMVLIGIIMIGASVGFVYKNAKQAK